MGRDTDGASKDWYRTAAVERSDHFPGRLLFDAYELQPDDLTVAPTVAGAPTIYRRTLLTASTAALAEEPGAVAELSAALTPLGWSLALAPPPASESADGWLEITGDAGDEPDAWPALQTLTVADGLSDGARAVRDSLSLGRLSFIGMPAKEGHAGGAGTAREAIDVLAPAPRWRPIAQVPGGRRPVVALLDSGVGHHPWLGTESPHASSAAADAFCVNAEDLGFVAGGPPLPRRGSGNTSPHDGLIDTHAGHGTFIAGLIRQLTPDAQVLMMHVMHGDGVLDEGPVNAALEWLLDRVRRAPDDPSLFVDVVCLSFGYYEQQPSDNASTTALRHLLGELGDLGVRVVASAGNHASAAPVCPAMFASSDYEKTSTAPATQLVSVGALNPDGSRAAYSNFGDWVSDWTVGSGLMSTIPVFGTLHDRDSIQAFDAANLVDGFARWSGTSFAAAVFAGRLAQALLDDARPGEASLRDVSPPAAQRRATRALDAVRHP